MGDKRSAIAKAALELFVDLGFHGTTVPVIATKAQVGTGTIYRYFASKEGLVNEIYRDWKLRFAQHVMGEGLPEGTVAEQFRITWMRVAQFAADHPLGYAFIEQTHPLSYLDAASVEAETRLMGEAIAFIEGAQRMGAIGPGDPQVLWALVEGAFIGMVRASRAGRLVMTPDVIEAACATTWKLLAPRGSHDVVDCEPRADP